MAGIIKYIKKHKAKTAIFIIAFCFILFLLITFKILFFSSSGDKYGNRLDGIESVVIDNDITNKIKKSFKDDDEITSVSYNLEGRLINIHVIVKNDTEISTIENKVTKVLDIFKEEEKSYYDIQIFIKSEGESELYPIIGYKHKTSDSFSWNKN